MSISLNKPAQGTPNWHTTINANWTTIEECFNGTRAIGPLDCSSGQLKNLQVENVSALPGAPHTAGRIVYLTTDSTIYRNNGSSWASVGSGASAHNMLSTTHSDTTAAAVARGSIIVGGSAATWERLTIGTSGKVLRSDGTDILYSTWTIAATFAQGSIPYADLANSLSALTIGAANSFLNSTGTLPQWYNLFGSVNNWTVTQNFTAGMNVTAGQNIDLAGGSGSYFITRDGSGDIGFYTGNTLKFEITNLGNIVCGAQATLSTLDTDGFLYIPTSAGTPTGVPTGYSGKVSCEFDTTNRLPYFNDTGSVNPWRFAQLGNSAALTDGAPVTLTVINAYLYTLTATADRTINASGGGIGGQRISVAVQSDAAASRTITFGTNFKSTGTVSTPATASKYVVVGFTSDGSNWLEEYRQVSGV